MSYDLITIRASWDVITFAVMSGLTLLCFVTGFFIAAALPIVLKGSSPSGETVIAISSSDPNVERYISFNFPNKSDDATEGMKLNPGSPFQKTIRTAVAGTHSSTGRGFGPFNPSILPFFNFLSSFEGFGPNFGPWIRGVESQDPMGNGEVRTVTAINDNGHVYGKVKTITFDNKKTQ